MPENELYCKRVMGAIGASMLIFWGLMNIFGTVYAFFSIFLSFLPIPMTWYMTIDQLFYAAGYMTTFMLPVAFLRLFLKKKGIPNVPMRTDMRISRYLPMMILATVAISFSAAQINQILVSIFNYSEFSSEFLWGEGTSMEPYELVLNFIVMCVVPGFCEEFLFRGAILSNCRVFGRSNAIFISAFLFSMMHQNIEQILYTFVAGILLGLIYEYTGSIWNCTVLHILNNFVSVIETAIMARVGSDAQIANVIMFVEGIIYLLGALSALFLIAKFFSEKRDPTSDGIFGRDLPESDSYAACPVEARRMRKLFLRPTMIIFLSLCMFQILMLIFMAVLA